MATEPGEELTERELEITALVTEGLTNRDRRTPVPQPQHHQGTPAQHLHQDWGRASRTELSMLAVQEGWVAVSRAWVEPAATPSTDSLPLASTKLDEGALDQAWNFHRSRHLGRFRAGSRWHSVWPWHSL